LSRTSTPTSTILDPRLWSMSDRELAQVLPSLTRLRHRIAAH
jgi:hypothetical protein